MLEVASRDDTIASSVISFLNVPTFRLTKLEEPCSLTSFAPAALIIAPKIKITIQHGSGWWGCIREKSASRVDRSVRRILSKGGSQHYILI